MAVDVIIDPSSGQIYWNDAAGSGTQTIAISGNATNAINIVGYSNFFSPGGGGLGTNILATFNDSATSTFVPGTNAYDLGSTALRWNFYGTAGNFTGVISTSSATASISTSSGALTVTGGVGIGGSLWTNTSNVSSISGVQFLNSRAQNGFTINATSSYTFNIQDAANNQRLNYHADSNRTEFTGNNATHEIRLIHSNNSSYTGFKANSSGTVTYTLPAGDGSANQVLYTNGSAALGWTTPSGSAAGSSTQVQYNQGGAFGATSSLTYDPAGQKLSAPFLAATNSQANEGGEITMSLPTSGSTLATSVTVDIYQNRIRFFETGSPNKGAYIDLSACSSSVGTNLLVGSGASGLTSLNGLTASTQTFATGTSGTDFNISSSTSTHTFNIPYAGSGATGLVTTQAQTIAGVKTFSSQTIISDTTASTTTATGAMLIFGGLGVSGQINSVSLVTSGNAVINGNLQFKGNGTFGDATTDTITSLARYASDLLPSADNTYDLGNNSLGWRNFKISGVGTVATLQVTSVTSGLWAGTAITLAYGGTNNTVSGVGHSYRVAIYDASGTAITNISSAGTANSVLFQSSQSASPNWVGQGQLVVGGASTAANIQGGALGNIHYQTGANATGFISNAAGSGASVLTQTGNVAPIYLSQAQLVVGGASTSANIQGGSLGNLAYQTGANATGFVTNAAGSGASILTQTGNSAPIFFGQSQLLVGSASTTAQIVTDSTTATRYIVGTILNTASSGGTVLSTGSGITIGNNLLTVGSLAVTNNTGSASTSTGALVITGGVGIGGTLNVGTRNLTYSASGLLAGFAGSINSYVQIVLQNLSTGNAASSDFIVNNDQSTDATYYGSMGMNSSTFTGAGSLNLPNAVYFTSTTGDLILGSTTANILRFVYNSGSSDSMQITGTAVSVLYTTGSSSTTTGALTIGGGVGIGGSLWTAATNFSSISGVGFSNSVITSGVWSGTAVSATNGGTGQVSYAIGDILYASSTTALTRLAAGTAGSVLASGGAGAAPFWKVDATGSGGAPGGSNYQLQYNNASAFGGASRLLFNALAAEEFLITSPYQTTVNASLNIGLGTTSFDGTSLGRFTGSSNGTVFAINQTSGFTGNFADFQLAGSSKFTIGFDGKITVVGVYSLPTTAGTAGSVLTSNGTGGQFYWSAPGTGGGGAGTVASGTANQVAYYPATGASVTGAANLTYNTTSVIVANTTASNNNTSGALLVFGGIGASGQISGAGASFTSTVFLNGIRIGQGGNNITFTDAAGTTIGDFNTSNGWLRSAQVTQSTSSTTGALVSSGGLGVAKAASIGETIYGYSTVASTGWSTGSFISSGGLGVSKASYFNGDLFVTSGTNSTSLATGALVISGGVGIGKTMFVGDNINIFKSGSVGALRLWNSANTFYTGIQAASPSSNTTYTLPAAFPGSGTSVLSSDTSGTMNWVAPGGSGTVTTLTSGLGISFSTGTTITTTGTVRFRRPVTLIFCTGYTPAATGADSVVIKVPDNQNTGASDRIFNCIEASVRVETASGTASTIRIEKYAYAGGTGVSAFSTSSTGSTINILSGIGITLVGATAYENSVSTFAAGHGTCASGDKLRLNFTQLSATHANFSVRLVLEEQ